MKYVPPFIVEHISVIVYKLSMQAYMVAMLIDYIVLMTNATL